MDSVLRSKIRWLARKMRADITDADLYGSPELQKYLEDLSGTFIGRYGRPVQIFIEAAGEAFVAYTNGNQVHLNWQNRVIRIYRLPESRFAAFRGTFFHEIAHILYCDFDARNKAAQAMKNDGTLFPDWSGADMSETEQKDWAEIVQTAADHPEFRDVIEYIIQEVDNPLIDVHDEACMIAEWGDFVAEGLTMAKEALRSTATPLDEWMESVATEDGTIPAKDKLSIIFAMLLSYARFGGVIVRDEDAWDQCEFKPLLARVAPYIEVGVSADSAETAFNAINHILTALWPYVREVLKNGDTPKDNDPQSDPQSSQQNGQPSDNSQGGQSGGNNQGGQSDSGQSNPGQSGPGQSDPLGGLTSEQIQAVMSALEQGVEHSGSTQAPQNRVTSAKAKEEAQQNRPRDGKPEQGAHGADRGATDAAMDRISQKIAERMAEQSVENAVAQSTMARIKTVNQNDNHAGVKLTVVRNLEVTDDDVKMYNDTMRDIRPYSRRLQQKMRELMRDCKEGEVTKHRPYGDILVATDAYRADQRYFATKKLPQDLPDMAISVLCDNSGSMAGQRIRAARKAAMLLYDFATALDIPIMVSGHDCGSEVIFRVFADFNRVNTQDKYRIAKMSSGMRNRDGMAIECAAKLLSERTEQTKLLFIISDGQPNAHGYGGDEAAKDIQSIVRRYQRRGLTIIAAAIGDDKDTIRAIYGDGFLDISDLSKLPKLMVNIVRKRLMASM